jgi:hypothetical protein
MLIPLLVYGVVSGRIKALKAPGGWEATFEKVGAQSVDVKDVAIEDTKVIEKKGPRETLLEFEQAQPGRPVVMSLKLGTEEQKGDYDANAVLQVVETASQHPEFKFIVVVDQNGKVVSYAPVSPFKAEIRRDTAQMIRLVYAINNGNVERVKEFPEMRTETISTKTSNAEALELMQKMRLDTILATDENRRPIGVVERQHILNQMVAQLAKHANE